MNTVIESFDTTVRQMTEMFHWPKFCSKNDRNVSAKKKQLRRPRHSIRFVNLEGFGNILDCVALYSGTKTRILVVVCSAIGCSSGGSRRAISPKRLWRPVNI